MFLQDHRENGKLQPDHQRDSTSVGAPGWVEKLHHQSAQPLQLRQRGRHPAGEEHPAAADTATGLTGSGNHHDPLHQLVRVITICRGIDCVPHACIYAKLCKNYVMYLGSGNRSMYRTKRVHKQMLALAVASFPVFLASSLCVIYTYLVLFACFFCLPGSWRVSCVRPATPSSFTVLQYTALSARIPTASQVSEQKSSQTY